MSDIENICFFFVFFFNATSNLVVGVSPTGFESIEKGDGKSVTSHFIKHSNFIHNVVVGNTPTAVPCFLMDLSMKKSADTC